MALEIARNCLPPQEIGSAIFNKVWGSHVALQRCGPNVRILEEYNGNTRRKRGNVEEITPDILSSAFNVQPNGTVRQLEARHGQKDINVAPTIICTNHDGHVSNFYYELDVPGTWRIPAAHDGLPDADQAEPQPGKNAASVWRKLLWVHLDQSMCDGGAVQNLKTGNIVVDNSEIEARRQAKLALRR